MNEERTKILVIVEGAKTDVRLMEHLLSIYGIDEKHQIVSYNTNIYSLYNEMFREVDPENIDILQLMKEHENDLSKKEIFDVYYSDILLIFDFDPHDPQFLDSKISEMLNFFVESSDMGKLYLNYAMVEAFYHMKSIPDEEYESYIVTMDELIAKKYKQRVNYENRNHDYSKFAVNISECNTVICQNIDKSWKLCGLQRTFNNEDTDLPDSNEILQNQLLKMNLKNELAVLCTCVFYIVDYNAKLIL